MGSYTNCCRTLLLILIPVVLLFILFLPKTYQPHKTHELKFAFEMCWVYVFFLMGLYWILNVFNITATAFLALIMLPFLGIITAKTLADAFMSDHNVTVFGSITLMLAADSCGIRRRVALLILKHSSGSIRWIFIDIYLATLWISMWINSSAATFFMMRVLDDMIETLRTDIPSGALGEAPVKLGDDSEGKDTPKGNNTDVEVEAPKESESAKSNNASKKDDDLKEDQPAREEAEPTSEQSKDQTSLSPEQKNELLLNNLGGELLYCIAVAANIGGTLWPYGNPMGFDIMKMKYTIPKVKKGPLIIIGLSEASWIIYMLPLLIVNASIALWFLMSSHFGKSSKIFNCLRPDTAHATDLVQNKESLKTIGAIFSAKYVNLPKWNAREKSLLIMIIMTIAICLTRRPVFVNGWNEMIHRRLDPAKSCDGLRLDIGDSVSLTIMVLLLFIYPAWGLDVFKGPPVELKKKGKIEKPVAAAPPATKLTWKKLQTFYPYTIMMLIGGATCFGRNSEKPFAVPMAEFLVRTIPGDNTALLKLVMISLTLVFSIFIPNPGTSAAIMNLWYNMMVGYKGRVHGASILPILSVASLCFVVPSSSVPTALVYIYQGKKKLSVWHFLRLGIPLLLCTLISTIIYALIWSPNWLSIVQL